MPLRPKIPMFLATSEVYTIKELEDDSYITQRPHCIASIAARRARQVRSSSSAMEATTSLAKVSLKLEALGFRVEGLTWRFMGSYKWGYN